MTIESAVSLPIKEKEGRFNPAVWEARQTQRILEFWGSTSKIIGDGVNTNLQKVFEQSLLGYRLKGVQVEQSSLTPYEQSLIGDNPGLFAIVDWDGVMATPLHDFFSFLKDPKAWLKGLSGLKSYARIEENRWNWLKDMAESADRLLIWSSRRHPDESNPFIRLLVKPFKGESEEIDYFPVFTDDSLSTLYHLQKGRMEIEPEKPYLFQREQVLEKIVNLINNWEIIYYVGSSHFDRETAKNFVIRNSHLAHRFCFFDTAHLLL